MKKQRWRARTRTYDPAGARSTRLNTHLKTTGNIVQYFMRLWTRILIFLAQHPPKYKKSYITLGRLLLFTKYVADHNKIRLKRSARFMATRRKKQKRNPVIWRHVIDFPKKWLLIPGWLLIPASTLYLVVAESQSEARDTLSTSRQSSSN